MKSLFDPSTYTELSTRIAQLRAETPAQWGKMNAGQMLAHCNEPLQNALGRKHVPKTGNFIIRLLAKKYLYNDKPYRKGLPTAKPFIMNTPKDFEAEKAKMLDMVREAHQKGLQFPWPDHPAFGRYTPEQHGMMMYKHIDHHLRQFGL
jgi:hypothetical protein